MEYKNAVDTGRETMESNRFDYIITLPKKAWRFRPSASWLILLVLEHCIKGGCFVFPVNMIIIVKTRQIICQWIVNISLYPHYLASYRCLPPLPETFLIAELKKSIINNMWLKK